MLADLNIYDGIGIVGSLFIAGAYLAISMQWMKADTPRFQLLNLIGAVLILWSLWHRPNAGAILIEVLWIGIAITALFGHWRRKSRGK